MNPCVITTITLLVLSWTLVTCLPEDLSTALEATSENISQPIIDKTISMEISLDSHKAGPTKDHKIYEGCGQNKTCFGYPLDCVENKSCFEMASATTRGDFYEFELKTSSDGTTYVAVGLSLDQRMGDDLVTACINDGGNVSMKTSLTLRFSDTRAGVPQNTARLKESSYKDGILYCRFERDAETSFEGHTFDLSKNKYFLLLAAGSKVKDNRLEYHDLSRTVSLQSFT